MRLPSDFRAGVRDVAPLLLGVVPFGTVAGIAAVNAGLGFRHAVGFSLVVFAGASQLAALDLLAQGTPVTIVVLTAVVINLRMVMYSASLAPHLRDEPARWKALLAYLLTDQAYALSIAKYKKSDVDRRRYYFGAALTLWVVWQVSTVAGVFLGAGIPDAWGLEFAVPLIFLALLVPAMEDAATSAAGIAGGVVAIAGVGLPLNLGLLVGATVGIVVGLVTESLGVADGG